MISVGGVYSKKVPEPTSVALTPLGVSAMVALRRRQVLPVRTSSAVLPAREQREVAELVEPLIRILPILEAVTRRATGASGVRALCGV